MLPKMSLNAVKLCMRGASVEGGMSFSGVVAVSHVGHLLNEIHSNQSVILQGHRHCEG